ncbi:MAG: D-2-hydroxyacid dehydrogenase [Thermomicrobiales bacterium]|nr:D-2-hydroxyacid dehydrogenase [Thermomicrobiales bacterium]
MNRRPVVLIYSGQPADDEAIRRAVADRYPEVTPLTANTPEEVAERLPQAEILFAWTFPVEFLPLSQKLRWFQVMGAGLERIAAGPALPEGVTITNLKGVFGSSMGEYALAYMLAHTQRIRMIVRNQDAREWVRYDPGRLEGSTVGIAGLGSIGQEVSRRCAALGMRVVGLKRHAGDVPNVGQVYAFEEIDRFLPECDFLILVLPQTAETIGLLTRDRLRSLKPDCFLVNMGRGSVMREDDLVAALQSGWIAGAALDVFATEPLPPESPLWGMENVYITPHISGTNRPDELVGPFIENLGRYLRGEPLLYQVDLQRGY